MTSDLEELEAKMGEPTFWNDTRTAASVSRKKVTLERELTQWREVEAGLKQRLRALKRVQVPHDVVGAMLFLASPLSDFITGQTVNVDGGISFL